MNNQPPAPYGAQPIGWLGTRLSHDGKLDHQTLKFYKIDLGDMGYMDDEITPVYSYAPSEKGGTIDDPEGDDPHGIADRWKNEPLTSFAPRRTFGILARALIAAARDAELWKARAEQLSCMADGETAQRYWAKVDALIERNKGAAQESAGKVS
jgi:hypothetical protein